MTEPIDKDIHTQSRIKLLMIFRALIVSALLILVVFMDIKRAAYLTEISIPHFYGLVLLSYVLSLLYLLFFKTIRSYRINIYIQTFCDIAVITGLVYVTGGIRSIYTAFYPLVIIYAVLFLGRNGGIISASGCSIFYGLLVDFEFYGVIPTIGANLSGYSFNTSYVFLRIVIHIFSFYTIAALASFVVEREKQARVLLAEKETAFNRLDRLYRSIIESIDAGILTVDLEGRIKSFNRGAEEITGFSFWDVENRNLLDIFPALANVFGSGKPFGAEEGPGSAPRVEVPFTDKANQELMLGCSVSSLREEKGEKIGEIIIFQDLTQIKRMEDAVEKSKRLAFVGEMAASMAHELRNPLASISGSIQMLRRDLSLRMVDERLMQIIIRGKDQLENFIKDFLLLARHTPRDYEEFDFNTLASEVIDSLKLADEWSEMIGVQKIFSSPIMLHANKQEMRQVISNLTLNAVQAMPQGGALVIETRKKKIGLKDLLEMTISDSGSGMNDATMKRIFEPFYTTKDKGTGLGLAIVSRILDASSGEITVKSVLGVGTTFTVRLPLDR